jgi:Bacterial type II and III secretion system protein
MSCISSCISSRIAAVLISSVLLGSALPAASQTGRQVKVVVEFQQKSLDSRQGVQGQGGVIVQDGKARGRGGVGVQDTTTRTTRSEGVFTVVQDGGASSMVVATEVPYTVLSWFRDYATGQGYAAQATAWQRVGTTLVVRPTILPDGQIRVRLTPQVSYFSPQGDGSIEFNEAATEVIVPNGRAMRIGGATRGINQVTRQILGYREQQSSSESSFILTATIQ